MDGKKVVVVGAWQQAGASIGTERAIAELMAREGAEVCAVDVERGRAADTGDAIVRTGGVAHVLRADVSDVGQCEQSIHDAASTMGGIDVLVHNVAVTAGDGHLTEVEAMDWQRLIDANLRSAWLVARAVLPIMMKQRSGVITNVSTISSRTGHGSPFVYGLAKAGLNALTHTIAREYAPDGIRCNAVLPGAIDTPLGVDALVAAGVAASREAVIAMRSRTVPLGQMGTVWDVAHAVLFLSSNDAGFITGVHLPVDGGALAMIADYQRPDDR